MKLTIRMEFNHSDDCEINLALTPEHAQLPKAQFIALAGEALGVIHANMQAYAVYCKQGTLDPRAHDFALQEK